MSAPLAIIAPNLFLAARYLPSASGARVRLVTLSFSDWSVFSSSSSMTS